MSRVVFWMIVAEDANKNISFGRAIYLQPTLSPHLPPTIPILLVSQTLGDWLVIIMTIISPQCDYTIPNRTHALTGITAGTLVMSTAGMNEQLLPG